MLNLLSLTATFGAMVWIFQDGHLVGLPRLHAHRDARHHHADPDVLHRLRPVDGLRGVPALADQGGARPDAATTRRRSPSAWSARAASSPRPRRCSPSCSSPSRRRSVTLHQAVRHRPGARRADGRDPDAGARSCPPSCGWPATPTGGRPRRCAASTSASGISEAHAEQGLVDLRPTDPGHKGDGPPSVRMPALTAPDKEQ